MYALTVHRRHARFASALLGAFAVLFLCAQLAGLLHSVSHLERSRATAHAPVCTLCVAAIESAGGPPSVAVAIALPVVPVPLRVVGVVTGRATLPVLRYRSRAPPATT